MLMVFRFPTGCFGPQLHQLVRSEEARMRDDPLRCFRRGRANFRSVPRTIWELMWLSSATFVLLIFPETSASNILYYRMCRLRKFAGNRSIMSAPEIVAAAMSHRDLAVQILVRPFALNFQEPIVFVLNAYIGLIYALLYIWFEPFPLVFISIYYCREQTLDLSFLGLFVGAFVVMPPFFAYLYYVQEPKYNTNGELRPEDVCSS